VRVRNQFVNNMPSYVLDTVKVEEDTDFDELSEFLRQQTRTKFRVILEKDTKLPGSFLVNNKNVLKVVGRKDAADSVDYKGKLEEGINNESLIADPMYGLRGYLKSRGHRKLQIDRSVVLVKEALSTLDTN
jgi:hypothetical protein